MKKNATILTTSFALLCLLCPWWMPIYAQTSIGGLIPDNSAMLDVQSTSKGVLLPRMTTAERDLINTPATGLMIFNTTTQCLEINLGSGSPSWQSAICAPPLVGALNCTGATLTGTLEPSTAASGVSVSVPYTGGNGLDHPGQTVNSTGVTGLTATLAPGTLASGAGSFSYAISGTPSAAGNVNFALSIVGQTCTLKVPICGAYVASGVWKAFSCYNLGAVGATTGADPFTPSWELNGDYYQWGIATKAADGPSAIDMPNSDAVAGWSNAVPPTSWSDSNTDNNPCPQGFRVPTKTQWEGVRASNAISNAAGASWTAGNNNYSSGKQFGSSLYLPAAGNRSADNFGSLANRDAFGYYWSSTAAFSDTAHSLFFGSGSTEMYDFYRRAFGFSVRCIAN